MSTSEDQNAGTEPGSSNPKIPLGPPEDNELVRAWQKRALQRKLERGHFAIARNAEHEAVLEKQHERLMLEIPRAINLDIMAEAYPIVLAQVQVYSRQLGRNNPITLEAITHLRRLAFVLGRECEYGAPEETP